MHIFQHVYIISNVDSSSLDTFVKNIKELRDGKIKNSCQWHPRRWKWEVKTEGCKITSEYDFLYVTPINDEQKNVMEVSVYQWTNATA